MPADIGPQNVALIILPGQLWGNLEQPRIKRKMPFLRK